MAGNFPYTISGRTVSIILTDQGGRVVQTDASNANWDQIREALNDPETTTDDLLELIDPAATIQSVADRVAQIRFDNGKLYWGDEEIHNHLASRVLEINRLGLDVEPWLLFAQNVYDNPFRASRDELLLFLDKADLPITPDGCFYAYKRVDHNYKDMHTHRIDNSVGQIVEMPRSQVNANRNQTCSTGLHFCSKDYLRSFGGAHVMIVKINPRDVVSIPTDYNNAKGRCCRYEVVGEIDETLAHSKKWAPVESVEGTEVKKAAPKKAKAKGGTAVKTKTTEKAKKKTFEITPAGNLILIHPVAGRISADKLTSLLRKHSTVKGVAAALKVTEGTVRGWQKRFKAHRKGE